MFPECAKLALSVRHFLQFRDLNGVQNGVKGCRTVSRGAEQVARRCLSARTRIITIILELVELRRSYWWGPRVGHYREQ